MYSRYITNNCEIMKSKCIYQSNNYCSGNVTDLLGVYGFKICSPKPPLSVSDDAYFQRPVTARQKFKLVCTDSTVPQSRVYVHSFLIRKSWTINGCLCRKLHAVRKNQYNKTFHGFHIQHLLITISPRRQK
jgi:hypothetical protein